MSPEALFLEGFLWHDEIFVAEADILLGDRYIVTIFRILMLDKFVRIDLSIFPIIPLNSRLDGVVGLVRQQDYTLAVLAQGPRRQIVVLACALGRSLLDVRGHILRPPGL